MSSPFSYEHLLKKDAYNNEINIVHFLKNLCKTIEKDLGVNTVLMAFRKEGFFILYDKQKLINDEYKKINKEEQKKYETVDDNKVIIQQKISYNKKPIFLLQIKYNTNKKNDIQKKISTLAEYMDFVFKYKEEVRFNQAKDNLLKQIFEKDLSMSDSWKEIAKSIVNFLPDFKLSKESILPLCQILTYQEGDKHIIMRASQSDTIFNKDDNILIPLRIDETVCGVVIEDNLDFLNTNPSSKYKNRYQGYLYFEKEAKSELVFTIKNEKDKVIALLNLEHIDENFFGNYSIEVLKKTVKFLSPLIVAILSAETIRKNKEISRLYTMTKTLDRLSGMYKHKLANSFIPSYLAISNINRYCKENNDIKKQTDIIERAISKFENNIYAIVQDLPEIITLKSIGIRQAIRETLENIDYKSLEQNQQIKFNINYNFDDEKYVFASKLLKEHMYNMLNNSLYSIKEKKLKTEKDGVIDIVVSHESVTDTLKKDSTSISRIYITIKDNGMGASKKDLTNIGTFGFTTKGDDGTGYGLAAAEEYVQSIDGGSFKKDAKENEYFKVSFFLQEYESEFHDKDKRSSLWTK